MQRRGRHRHRHLEAGGGVLAGGPGDGQPDGEGGAAPAGRLAPPGQSYEIDGGDGQEAQPDDEDRARAAGQGAGDGVGAQRPQGALARLVRGAQHQQGEGGGEEGPPARPQQLAEHGRVRRTADRHESRRADEQGNSEVGQIAGDVVEALGRRILGGTGVHAGRGERRLADGEREGAGDGVTVGRHHPPGDRVGPLGQLRGQRHAGRFTAVPRVRRLARAQAAPLGVQDAEGVVEQTDRLREGQGEVAGGRLEDGSVLGIGGTEGRVSGCRSRAAEEEQDQQGDQQHQPLKSPSCVGSAGSARPSSSVIAPHVCHISVVGLEASEVCTDVEAFGLSGLGKRFEKRHPPLGPGTLPHPPPDSIGRESELKDDPCGYGSPSSPASSSPSGVPFLGSSRMKPVQGRAPSPPPLLRFSRPRADSSSCSTEGGWKRSAERSPPVRS